MQRRIDLDDVKITTAVLQGRWKTTILARLADGPLRFAALRRAVGGVSEKVLARALRDLEAEGLVSRTVEDVVPPRVEYAMTDYGRTLCDVVAGMAAWGKEHGRRARPRAALKTSR